MWPASVSKRVFAVAIPAVLAGPLAAQDYPTKPIRWVTPYPPGGSTTFVSRLIGDRLAEAFGKPVVIDNRPGGNTVIGAQVVGDGSIVRRNLVLDTGGSTHASSLDTAIGIDTAYNVDVLDNTIDSVEATGTAGGVKHGIGIRTEYNTAATIARNRVRVVIAAGGGAEIGIQNLASGRLTLLDNILSGMSGGYGDGTGIVCEGSNGVAVRNIMNGYATGLDGCVNSGGNVHML